MASASADSTIKIWDLRSGKCLRTLESYAYAMVFSLDDTLMASASVRYNIRIWDPNSGEHLKTLRGHEDLVAIMAFSPDATRLVSSSHDCTIKLWDLTSGEYLETFQEGRLPKSPLAVSPDSKLVRGDYFSGVLDDDSIAGYGQISKRCRERSPISFDTTGQYIVTRWGLLDITHISPPSNSGPYTSFERPHGYVYDVSADRRWITWNGINILRVPPDFLPYDYCVLPWNICIFCCSGRVLTFKFSTEISPLEQRLQWLFLF